MDKTYICRRIPNEHNFYMEMLIFQQMENGVEAVVGSVRFSYDEDCTDVEISYGEGKIFYRHMDFPAHSDWVIFFADKLGGREIAAEYLPAGGHLQGQQFLRWADWLLQVHCECPKEGPGAVTISLPVPAGTGIWPLEKQVLRIQPQVQGRDTSWTARIPEAYPQELCMILATLPLSVNCRNFMYAPWVGV